MTDVSGDGGVIKVCLTAMNSLLLFVPSFLLTEFLAFQTITQEGSGEKPKKGNTVYGMSSFCFVLWRFSSLFFLAISFSLVLCFCSQ